MADKLMYIPNDDIQNYPYSRLKLLIERFELKSNSPMLLSQRIGKLYYKTLETRQLTAHSLSLSGFSTFHNNLSCKEHEFRDMWMEENQF